MDVFSQWVWINTVYTNVSKIQSGWGQMITKKKFSKVSMVSESL